jgi:DnaJ domain
MAQTYYEILGVAQTATAEEIETAFKKRAREVHPDTVAPGNAYLRQVAAEAFKDLSEAKAVLLNPFEREKYDAKLMYERGAKPTGASPSPIPPPRQGTPRPQTGNASQSFREKSSGARAAQPARPIPHRPPFRVIWKPLGASLESFAFVIVGVVSIFFVAWLMASGNTPPLWAAALTLALGVASFRHGLKPPSSPKMRGALVPLLIAGFVIVTVFFAIWLPSTETVVRRGAAKLADVAAKGVRSAKNAGRFSSKHPGAPDPSIVVVDQSTAGDPPGVVTKIWKDMKDGKNYRSREIGDVLFLEVVEGTGKSPAGIVHCDFRRADQDWTGTCSERNAKEPGIRYAGASLSTFSDSRIEGRTIDIPGFRMVLINSVAMGSPGTFGPANPAEPDLSTLTETEKQSIETACASDKLLAGPGEYNQCVRKQIDALRSVPKAPDLSGLSSRDRDSMELVCSNAKLMEGPAAYNQCLARQLDLIKKQTH